MTHVIDLKNLKNDEIVFQGNGEMIIEENGNWKISFQDRSRTFHYAFEEPRYVMDHKTDMAVHLEFDENEEKNGWIETVYGRIDVQVKTRFVQVMKDAIEFAYTLSIHGEEETFHFRLEYTKRSDEVCKQ